MVDCDDHTTGAGNSRGSIFTVAILDGIVKYPDSFMNLFKKRLIQLPWPLSYQETPGDLVLLPHESGFSILLNRRLKVPVFRYQENGEGHVMFQNWCQNLFFGNGFMYFLFDKSSERWLHTIILRPNSKRTSSPMPEKNLETPIMGGTLSAHSS
jgi:hypothetical protein